jgi:Phage-related protein
MTKNFLKNFFVDRVKYHIYVIYYRQTGGEILVEVIYYEDKNGQFPVIEFIAEQDETTQAKILRSIDLLRDLGLKLRGPHNKKLENTPFWELRIQLGNNIYRIIFGVKGKAILLHGFQKKSQKTPPSEIRMAAARWEVYLSQLHLNAIKNQKGKKRKIK